jgi:outer membrane protein assembly factor BamE
MLTLNYWNILMRKIFTALVIGLTLAGCTFIPVHKMDIEQGNITTPEMLSQLHRGMSESDVKAIMGNPVLTNVFDENRVNYIYTNELGSAPMTTKCLTLTFSHGRLVDIKGTA